MDTSEIIYLCMKSMISMAAVLFAALMTTTVLTSCGTSDDEPAKAK